jgi:hypothetical protein
VDSGDYIVKPRPENPAAQRYVPPAPAPQTNVRGSNDGPHYEQIQLTYLDPADLAQVLGLINIPTFTRQLGGQAGGGPASGRSGNYGNAGALGLGGITGAYSDYGTGNSIISTFTPGSGYGNYTPGTPGAPGAPGSGNTPGNR